MSTSSIDVPTRADGLMASALHVVSVFPSAESVPENLLRFHVFFNVSPAVDRVLEAVRLVDKLGANVSHPFLDLQGGMWDASGTRLTLLLHPGRLKSGLMARERLGSALSSGRDYRLEIDLAMLADDPKQRPSRHAKAFRVKQPLVDAVNPSAWKLHFPRSESRDPLQIDFGRSMDRMALESGLLMLKPDNTQADFSLTIARGEETAYLTPESVWQTVPYRLMVSPELEDVAGNRPSACFESIGGYEGVAKHGAFDLIFEPYSHV